MLTEEEKDYARQAEEAYREAMESEYRWHRAEQIVTWVVTFVVTVLLLGAVYVVFAEFGVVDGPTYGDLQLSQYSAT